MGGNGTLVGEQVDVEEVAADTEVVEDARVEEGAPKTTTVGGRL